MKRPKINFMFSIFWTGFKPRVHWGGLMWKDKFGTPRCELPPTFEFNWLWCSILIIVGSDDYWEQRLWVNNYYNGDIKKAREDWPWVTGGTNISTWKNKYLKKKNRI